jgi:hypothetical protein
LLDVPAVPVGAVSTMVPMGAETLTMVASGGGATNLRIGPCVFGPCQGSGAAVPEAA